MAASGVGQSLITDSGSIDREVIQSLPEKPGIYIFKDLSGKTLYIGKAVHLRSRVRNYFGKNPGRGPWISRMVQEVAFIQYIITENEVEALILESNYVKKSKPKYNVMLRDDKHYPFLKLSTNEDYPRLSIVRRPGRDGATYLGPFPSAGSVRRTIRFIHKNFNIRACTGGIEDKTAKRCLYYQMGQCLGPCDGLQSLDDYQAKVRDSIDFLKGGAQDLLERLRAEMEEHARSYRFEAAAKIRDQIKAIKHVIEKQQMISAKGVEQDVLGFHREGDKIFFRLFFVRDGRLLADQGFVVPMRGEIPDEEIVSGFIKQYYGDRSYSPDEVLLPAEPPDSSLIAGWLSERKGRKVIVHTPRRGDKKRLVEMACKNASQALDREGERIQKEHKALGALQQGLNLEELPTRIEAFDVSNLHGSHIVGASVTFYEGHPMKDGYRRYNIRSTEGVADDFASMREIVTRRLERLVNQGEELPHLIVIDGGKGQLSAVVAAVEEVGVADVALCSLSKGRSADSAADQDVVYLPNQSEYIRFHEGSPEKLLLQRIRDEVHRFAVTFHRTRRVQSEIRSGLDDVPGLGPKRRRALLRTFGSLHGVLTANDEQLLGVEGINQKIVDSIREKLGGIE